MNTKVLVVAVVAVLAIAGVTTFIILNLNNDSASYDSKAINVVSRVNSEGSGLFIKNDVVTEEGGKLMRNGVAFFGDNYSLSKDNKAAWGGLILGDPGSQSIQHTQLATIASKVGLVFEQYTDETGALSNEKLYYVTDLSNYGKISADTDIKGGIIWEPQFQRVIQEDPSYRTLALTNDVFHDHACCVIAMNHDWAKANSTVAVKFLAGYIKAVDFINTAKKNTSGDDYASLVAIAKSSTVGLTDAEVTAALSNITYLYADDDKGSLADLTTGIGTLANDLKDLGIITSEKFKDGNKFAKAFVDDSYLRDAVAGKASKEGTDSITVAVINGDIHQIAIQVAVDKGFFDEYGLTVTLNKGSSSGGDVVGLLLSGDVKIGFLGAPPATIKTINGEHIIV